MSVKFFNSFSNDFIFSSLSPYFDKVSAQKLSSSVTNQGDITEKDSQICQLESQLARLKDNLSRQGMEMQDLQQLYQNE
jgi:hypothetical protein